ncbi:ADP/ATP translocase [Aphelenchoides bicaudatus]|nr:ADP/ATP translocase [Aphelenchoides bicaudatus]
MQDLWAQSSSLARIRRSELLRQLLQRLWLRRIERVKLILQLQTAQVTIKADRRYKGMIDCFLRLPKEQGFLSFWRGNWSNILRSSSQVLLNLSDSHLKNSFENTQSTMRTKHQITKNLLQATYSLVDFPDVLLFALFIPLDFTRTRLSIDMGKDKPSREFKGLIDCFLKIARHDGFFGLYRGFLPSLQYIFLYRGAYYGLFDICKTLAIDKGYGSDNNLSFGMAFFIGQITTFVAAMISYPLDTVRRRLMMDAGKTVHAYHGTIDCTKKIYYSEGFKSFYSGGLVNVLRGFGAALILAMYNETSKYVN